ncbi:hypothetical protein A9239_17675 [Methanosarcina sp. A14]|nr:hypothetical protein A9239_17675 [Methanosarcina sp. A14]
MQARIENHLIHREWRRAKITLEAKQFTGFTLKSGYFTENIRYTGKFQPDTMKSHRITKISVFIIYGEI